MSEQQETKTEKTYLTARFADGKKANGDPYKNVMNLFFNGGFDSRGLPILSNPAEKIIGWVNKSTGRLDLRHTDGEGAAIKDGNGRPASAFMAIGLERFTAKLRDPKNLQVGEGTVSGPEAKTVIGKFTEVLNEVSALKAAKKKAAPSSEPSNP